MADGSGVREAKTICRCCTAGCGINVRIGPDNEILEVRGDPDHPESRGYVCPKGYNLSWHHTRPDLLEGGRVRGRRTTWDEATADLVASLKDLVAREGTGVIGTYNGTGGGGLDSASARTLRAFTTALGTKQVYTSVTVDNAPAWVAGDIVTGSGAELQPRWFPEDEDSKLVIFFGCNPIVSHGYFTVLPDFSRRIRAFRKRGGKVWVVDPRVTETVKAGDGHVQCLPGTDWLLLAWLLKEVIANPPFPERLPEIVAPGDLEKIAALVAPVTRAMVADRCDVSEEVLQGLLDAMRAAGRFCIVTGSGSVFADTGFVNELMRYAILAATDSLDQPGGARFEPSYPSKLEERTQWNAAPIEGRFGPSPASRPDIPGLFGEIPCAAMADEIEAGHLKALIVVGGSPLTALPDSAKMRRAMEKLEILAVVDIVETPLLPLATHVMAGVRHLEVASMTAWNGRACFGPAVVPISGDRGPAWKVCGRIGKALGVDVLQGLDPEEADGIEILRRTGKNARHDFDALMAAGTHGIALPEKTNWVLQHAVPGGRWRIASPALLDRLATLMANIPPPAAPNTLALICRRQNEHTNGTHYVREARRRDRPDLLMAQADAMRLGLADGQAVKVSNEVGAVVARVSISDAIRPGAVSLPHGYANANVSLLTSSAVGVVDPHSGQAPMTALRVTVEAVAADAALKAAEPA